FSAVLLLLFFHIPATTHIYTLSLHDALPISQTLAFPSPSRTAPPPAKRCRSGHLFPSLAPAPATCIETSQLSSLPQSPEPPVRRSKWRRWRAPPLAWPSRSPAASLRLVSA